MVIWAKRLYFDHSFDSCWAELIALSDRGITDVMMIEVPESSGERETIAIYIKLPDAQVLSLFPDFVQVNEAVLPTEAALLYGDVEAFRTRFSPIPPK
jgi:hypothetical protein